MAGLTSAVSAACLRSGKSKFRAFIFRLWSPKDLGAGAQNGGRSYPRHGPAWASWERGSAGHRDTFFRRLGDVKTGDVIELTTPRGQYLYAVRFTSIVAPDETWVLGPSTGQALTLVTCYPFYVVGAAPKRFIVRASRLKNQVGEGPHVRGMAGESPVAKTSNLRVADTDR